MNSLVQTLLIAPHLEIGNTSCIYCPSRKGKAHFGQVVA
jgi:hypothetical protein